MTRFTISSQIPIFLSLVKDSRTGLRVAPHVRALVVPGSERVKREMVDRGWDQVFTEAGFEFREAGCSMCLAMNPDKLKGREVCASSSNRNFKGRQGSPSGRTLAAMVSAWALAAVPSRTRPMMPWRMAPLRNRL